MAEQKKKIRFEAETSLPVKIKPAQKAARNPVHREEEPMSFELADVSDEDRKQVILRIIDYFKAI
jgi:hypothetical protein